MILRQLARAAARSRTSTQRVVPYEGNARARCEVMAEVFALRPHFEWRGLGFISQSGLKLSRRLRRPRRRAALRRSRRARRRPKACQCGEVLKGVIKPWSARSSAPRARPSARSARAWSREGACAAYYNYGRFAPGDGRSCERPSSDREQRILGIIETARAKRPKFRDERITMAHGAGGKATASLIEGVLVPALRTGRARRARRRGP
jgi:hypothetical protein